MLLLALMACNPQTELPGMVSLQTVTEPMYGKNHRSRLVRVGDFELYGSDLTLDGGDTWFTFNEPFGEFTRFEPLSATQWVLQAGVQLYLFDGPSGQLFNWGSPVAEGAMAWTTDPDSERVFATDAIGRQVYVRDAGQWVVLAELPWFEQQLSNRIQGFVMYDGALYVSFDGQAVWIDVDTGAVRPAPQAPISTAIDRTWSTTQGLLVETSTGSYRLVDDAFVLDTVLSEQDLWIACPDGSFQAEDRPRWLPIGADAWQDMSWVADVAVVTCDARGALISDGDHLMQRAAGTDVFTYDVPVGQPFAFEYVYGLQRAGDAWLLLQRNGARWLDGVWQPGPDGGVVGLPNGVVQVGDTRTVDGRAFESGYSLVPGSRVIERADGAWLAQRIDNTVNTNAQSSETTATLSQSTDQGQSWQVIHESRRSCPGSGGPCSGELHTFEVIDSTGRLVGAEFTSEDGGVSWSFHAGLIPDGRPDNQQLLGLTAADEMVVLSAGAGFARPWEVWLVADAGLGETVAQIPFADDLVVDSRTLRLYPDGHIYGVLDGWAAAVVRTTEPISDPL